MSSYSMKQVTYTPNSENSDLDLWQDYNCGTPDYFTVGNEYQDVIIPLEGSFDVPLYIDFYLKKNKTYPTTYKIKLVHREADYSQDSYEILKTFTVNADEGANTSFETVCLYADPTDPEKVAVAIPILIKEDEKDSLTSDGKLRCVVYDSNKKEYFLGNTKITQYNDTIMPYTWEEDDDLEDYYHFSGLVCSRYDNSNFNAIVIETVREQIDSELSYVVENNVFSGRYIDLAKLNFSAKMVNKLIPGDNEVIKKIGVQGPAGLTMMINGEEIKVGPSGVFELNNFDITSFGVCGSSEPFIVDYQYVTNEGE